MRGSGNRFIRFLRFIRSVRFIKFIRLIILIRIEMGKKISLPLTLVNGKSKKHKIVNLK